jgi:hypothetical protein
LRVIGLPQTAHGRAGRGWSRGRRHAVRRSPARGCARASPPSLLAHTLGSGIRRPRTCERCAGTRRAADSGCRRCSGDGSGASLSPVRLTRGFLRRGSRGAQPVAPSRPYASTVWSRQKTNQSARGPFQPLSWLRLKRGRGRGGGGTNSSRSIRRPLHRRHRVRRFASAFVPSRDSGTMWSAVRSRRPPHRLQ